MTLLAPALTLAIVAAPIVDPIRNEREQKAAAEALAKLGAYLAYDERIPGRPVVKVQLSGPLVTDAQLEHLKPLTRLQSLSLFNDIRVTDKGLKHLGGLEQLHKLTLPATETVTNDGVAELRKLLPGAMISR